jgi:hypothetical protein
MGLGHLPTASTALVMHVAVHGFYGALAALPTRRHGPIIAMALGAILIDVDHLAWYVGWPVPPRTNHSLFFLVLAPLLMAVVARAGLLGPGGTPRLAAAMAVSTVLAHLAWDALTGGEARVPFWLPVSARQVPVSPSVGAMLELTAVAVMWVAATADEARSRWRPAPVVVEPEDDSPPPGVL